MTMLREMMMLIRPLTMLKKKTDVVEDESEDIAKEVWKGHKSLFPTIQWIYRQFHDLTLGVIGISTNACARMLQTSYPQVIEMEAFMDIHCITFLWGHPFDFWLHSPSCSPSLNSREVPQAPLKPSKHASLSSRKSS